MAINAEIGTEGLNQFAGHIEESYLSQLRWPRAYDVYDEMRRRDPTLRSIVHVTKLLAKTAQWKVATSTDRPADREAGDFLASCLESMSHTVSDFIDDVFTSLPFGWSSFEIVYKRREDGRIGWQKLAYRRQSSWHKWLLDDNGGFQGWQQAAAPTYQIRDLPVRLGDVQKLLHFTLERDGNNPEGMALFESAYEPWHYVTNLQVIGGIGWQRSFVGLPVFQYEQRPTGNDTDKIRSIGQGLHVGAKQFVSVPPGIKFSLENSQNSGAESLLNYIKYFRTMMTQMVLADFLMLGTQGSGSWSLGSDKSMLFLMAVDAFLDRIAEIWNRYGVRSLFNDLQPANAFTGMMAIPRLTHTKVQKMNLGTLGAFVQQIASFIPLHNEDTIWVREQAGMPRPAPDSEPLPGTGGGTAPGTSPALPWQYPETRNPVGAEAAEFVQPTRAEDPSGSVKVAAESEAAKAILRYFSDLRRRILRAVKDAGIAPETPEVGA